MANSMSIEELIKAVQYLRDRQEILDCINRYSRALDRHDTEMMTTGVYHPDGLDEHGAARFNNPQAFMDWINEGHDRHFTAHHHHITVHNCDLDGDTAHTESYVILMLSPTFEPQKKNWILSGRYIDRLEKRDGKWKIALRTSVIEWAMEADDRLLRDPTFVSFGFKAGTHDRSDPSYDRPLTRDRALFTNATNAG
jgi:hypothetical protein